MAGDAKITILLRPVDPPENGPRRLLGLIPAEKTSSAAWVVANQACAAGARAVLLNQPPAAQLSPAVRTLRQTADSILANVAEAARPLTEVQRRALVAQVIGEATASGQLKHYAGVDPAMVVENVGQALTEISAHGPRDGSGRVRWAAPTDEPADRDLAILYHHYQEQLLRHRLLDAEGRQDAASRLLSSGQAGPLAGANTILASGFRALSAVELRLLVALGRHAGELLIELPWRTEDPPPDMSQLSNGGGESQQPASPRRSVDSLLRRLVREFDAVELKCDASLTENPAVDEPTVAVRRGLFCDSRDTPKVANAQERFTVFPARSAREEVEELAVRVKSLLQQGTPAEEIVVATPRVVDLADRVERAFAAAGLPVYVQRPRALGEAPLFRAAVKLFELATSDWRRDTVLDLVSLPAFTRLGGLGIKLSDLRPAGFADARAAAEWRLREVMLPGGQQAWLEHAGREVTPAEDDAPPRRRREAIAARAAGAAIELLDRTVAPWRRAAAPLDWFDRIRAALRGLGYASSDLAKPAALDAAAISALESAFADLDRLARWRGARAPQLAIEEVARLLGDWRRRVTLDDSSGDEGRVRLVSAETARRLRPEHLLLVGMGEQSMPSPSPAQAVAELRPSLEDHFSDQMLLFYELVFSAKKRVTFSYAALDSKSNPLSPSSYVAEIQRLVPSAKRTNRSTTQVSPLALRRASVVEFNEGEPASLPSALRVAPTLASGLRVALLRGSGDGFGEAEGVFSGEATLESIARRWGPDRQWSATQLETYGQCPFKFLMKHGLGIVPLVDFDLSTDYRRRGLLLHEAMRLLHKQLADTGVALKNLGGMGDEEFLASFQQAIDSAIDQTRPGAVEAALTQIEAQQAKAWGGGYQRQLEDYSASDEGLRGAMEPTHFETSFGQTRDGEPTEEPSRTEPFELREDGEVVLLTGRIDRIDVGDHQGQSLFNVIDYKTSSEVVAKADDVRSGRRLQLFLYTLATQQHLLADKSAMPWRLGYWEVQGGGFKQPKEGRTAVTAGRLEGEHAEVTGEWVEFEQAVRRRVVEIVRGVRRGEFPMFNADQECGRHCEFRTVCRVGQTRSLGKQPPGDAEEGADDG